MFRFACCFFPHFFFVVETEIINNKLCAMFIHQMDFIGAAVSLLALLQYNKMNIVQLSANGTGAWRTRFRGGG